MTLKNKKSILFLFVTLSLLTQDLMAVVARVRKGPNNGILRSAGRFQTELFTKTTGIEVYLLDSNARQATIEASQLEGQVYLGKLEYTLKFLRNIKGEKFFARWPAPINTVKKRKKKDYSIILLPTRQNVIGTPVVYKMSTANE